MLVRGLVNFRVTVVGEWVRVRLGHELADALMALIVDGFREAAVEDPLPSDYELLMAAKFVAAGMSATPTTVHLKLPRYVCVLAPFARQLALYGDPEWWDGDDVGIGADFRALAVAVRAVAAVAPCACGDHRPEGRG